jgi:hypothetical protein
MKKALLLAMFVVLFSSHFFAQEIRITYPRGGEKFCRGKDTIRITWDSDREYKDSLVKISLVDLGSGKTQIADNIANTGSHNWPIPDTVDAPISYIIRIKPKDFDRIFDGEEFLISKCHTPDLIVEDAWVEPKDNTRAQGNKITYKAKVKLAKLHGPESTAIATKAKLKIYRPQGLSPITVPPFDVKAFSNLNKMPDTLEYSFIPKTYGIYKYELKLDINNDVEEGDGESNNTDTHLSTVNPGPDLIVCLSSCKSPGACKDTTIIAWVRNIGEARSAPSTLTMYVKERGTTTHAVPNLAPNEMVHFTRTAKYCAKLGWKTMWAHINKDKTTLETNYDNNYVSTRYKVEASVSSVAACPCLNEYSSPTILGFGGEFSDNSFWCCSVKKNQ